MSEQKYDDLVITEEAGAAAAFAGRRRSGAETRDANPGVFRRTLRALGRRPWLAAALALGLVALALAAWWTRTPVYRARTAIEIERPLGGAAGIESGMEATARELRAIDAELATHIRVLESRPIVAGAIERLGAEAELAAEPGWLGRLFGSAPLPAADAALQALHVERSGPSRVLDIYFEHRDPELTARFANALAEEFIRHSSEIRLQAAERTANLLSGELGSTREQLDEMHAKLRELARSNGIVSFSGGSTLAEERLRQLQGDLSRAQSQRIVNQSRWEQAQQLDPTVAAATLDSQALHDHELQLANLRVELNALTTKFKPGYGPVRSLQAKIDFLEEKLAAERFKILARAQNEFEAAVKREEMLSEQYRRASGVVAVQQVRAMELDLLRQEAEASRGLYDDLLRRVKESAVAAAIGGARIRIVDPATPPRDPVRSYPLFASALGLALVGFAGAKYARAAAEQGRGALRTSEIPQALRAAELGCIPTLAAPSAPRLPSAGLLAASGEVVRAPGGSALGAGDPLAAASYQRLMTALLLDRRPGRPQVLAVSSPSRGDGKSTTVYNLAVSLAACGERVLVVDGDLRNPVQHELFGVAQRTGLGDLLEVGADEEGLLGADEARRSDRENLRMLAAGAVEAAHPDFPELRLIAAGIAPSRAARLLQRRGFASALMHRFRQFDVVLIDTPAVLDGPDARIFGRLADAVALVLRAPRASLADAIAARSLFQEDRTPVAGIVLNDCDRAL